MLGKRQRTFEPPTAAPAGTLLDALTLQCELPTFAPAREEY
jgi:hypothetical protein